MITVLWTLRQNRDITSCWMLHLTFLLASEEEVCFISPALTFVDKHTANTCTCIVVTEGEGSEWVSWPQQCLGGGGWLGFLDSSGNVPAPLLPPEPETIQLSDSQSGFGAAAGWGWEPEDSGGITAALLKEENCDSNQCRLKLWCKSKSFCFNSKQPRKKDS